MNYLLASRAKRAFALTAVACAGLLAPAAAQADVPITAFEAGPVAPYIHPTGLPLTSQPSFDTGCIYGTPAAPIDTSGALTLTRSTQAGATTDFCVVFRVNPGNALTGEDMKNTLVQLPVGTQADIDNAAKCSEAQFDEPTTTLNTCPPTSQVGTVLAQLEVTSAGPTFTTKDSPGRIYALDTPPGQAARLGVALIASTPPTTPTVLESKFIINVTQLGNPLVGLQNQTTDLDKDILTAPIAIKANALRFWGSASAHAHAPNAFAPAPPFVQPAADFFRVGTTCGTPQEVKLTVNPYTDAPFTTSQPTTATSTYSLTGCDSLSFNPSYSSTFSGETFAGGHPNLNVKITSPSADEDLGGMKITLPSNIVVDLSRAQNACPQATFEAAGCSSSAVIGSVTGKLSGINDDVVKGDVVMVSIPGKSLPGIGLNFTGRLPLRVVGVSTTDANNRVVNTFTNLPSLPIREVNVNLDGGTKGVLMNAEECSPSATEAVITGQNGKTKTVSVPSTCIEQIRATLGRSTSTSPTLTLGAAGATGKKLSSVRIGLPKGLRFVNSALRRSSNVTVSGLDAGVTGKTRVARTSQYAKFTFPAATNGYGITLKRGTLRATSSFAKSNKTVYVQFRYVYSDGTKFVGYAKLKR